MLQKKHAVLHIGLEKTGTTAIQSALRQSRKQLEAQGYLYSRAAGAQNHIGISVYGEDDSKVDDIRIALEVFEPGQVRGFRQKFKRDIIEECESSDAHTVIFSNEHCHSRLTTPQEVSRIAELFSEIFAHTKIIVYLRRQDQIATSLYSTAVKFGETSSDILLREKARMSYYDYNSVVARWVGAFGLSNMYVRLYDSHMFYNGSLIADFCRVSGIPEITERPRVNESLLPEFQELLRQINLLAVDSPVSAELRSSIVQSVCDVGSGTGRRPSRSEAIKFTDAFSESNEALRARFFPNQASLFSNDYDMYPVAATPPDVSPRALTDAFIRIISHRL